MVTIIGGIAEFERELIRARTGDGIRRAKAAGVHMGRPPKLTKHQQWEVLARLYQGEETLVEIARSYAVSHMTISRIKAQYAAAQRAARGVFCPDGRGRHFGLCPCRGGFSCRE